MILGYSTTNNISEVDTTDSATLTSVFNTLSSTLYFCTYIRLFILLFILTRYAKAGTHFSCLDVFWLIVIKQFYSVHYSLSLFPLYSE